MLFTFQFFNQSSVLFGWLLEHPFCIFGYFFMSDWWNHFLLVVNCKHFLISGNYLRVHYYFVSCAFLCTNLSFRGLYFLSFIRNRLLDIWIFCHIVDLTSFRIGTILSWFLMGNIFLSCFQMFLSDRAHFHFSLFSIILIFFEVPYFTILADSLWQILNCFLFVFSSFFYIGS